ncbi:MAG: 4Fe-4S ferredoxin [Methylibium sp. NZG]|nr:MAG: 4Fe-4S ferredoxin [Methylibium sp. NZG]
MPLDGPGLVKALGPDASDGLQTVHTLLCRREAGAFQRAAKTGDDLLVACTQESSLFLELNAQTEGAPGVAERPIRFVNIRETSGWSKDAKSATAKIAALIKAAQLPEPEPVPTVGYQSAGRVLVIGTADRAERAASMLADKLEVTLLLQGGGTLAQEHTCAVHAGRLTRISGWLGAFEVAWTASNPIDLDLCTRCNACIEVCPEGAIDFSYQIDLSRCKSHRDCVRVCDAAGAIDFQRAAEEVEENFDLVLDLNPTPYLSLHQPPQGYFHAADDAALVAAVLRLRDSVGEFEKPKFFQYKQKLCAHSRNERIGCSACIDVCSAEAIRSDASMKGKTGQFTALGSFSGGGIVVEPHLCVGCGACTTVCPSGAITYATPRADEQGKRIRTLLAAYQRAGAKDAALLIHSQGAGTKLIGELGRQARTGKALHGVPARVLPLDVWHTASTGIELWLSAVAFGASQVWVLMTDEEAPEYRAAVAAQMGVAQAILSGLGLAGEHFRVVSATDARTLDAALRAAPAATVKAAATYTVQADKRATLDLAIDHLMHNAAPAPSVIALPAPASPLGGLLIDTKKCTMCLSCVGACPESALADNPDLPQLRFIEKNCVQCGLCATTCPEGAITLEPRLWLADGGKARKQLRVLNEAQPYACIRCGKAFGTLQAIEAMVGKLAGHSMFQGEAADRLKMCGDCRVIDIHSNPGEVRITDL